MELRPQTIQIFLPDGQPRGLRIAEVTTRIVQAIQIPQNQLDRSLQRPELSQVALYFLFGSKEAESRPVVYIGQTEDLRTRLKKHSSDRDFWHTAVAIVSRTQSFTQAHIRYLEWHSIRSAIGAGRYSLDNGNEGSRPFVPEAMEADVLDAFETASVLLATLGFPIFEPLATPVRSRAPRQLFHCKGPDADATGELVEDGFVVLKGSTARGTLVPSAQAWIHGLRNQLVEDGTFSPVDGKLVVTKDFLFNSPSAAAAAILGRSANGWDSWVHDDGRTLHQIKRGTDTPATPIPE